MGLEIRAASPADAGACARICFDAFKGIAERCGYPLDFPSPEYARVVVDTLIGSPEVFGVVAERNGRVVGSNFLDERDPIRGVGPISVDPRQQGGGIGRRLMQAVLERGRDASGVRLLQDAHNSVSLSLYASLGFDVKEPIALMSGRPGSEPANDGIEVRRLGAGDLGACAELCRSVHGFERTGALKANLGQFGARVAVRDGRVVAYVSTLTVWPLAHGVAARDEDMRSLILGAAAGETATLSFLVPTRSQLFGWCVKQGMRTVKSMNLMSVGRYNEPAGAWFPSVMY
jgi:predicted N-acetyltransferase YhbS